MDLSQLNNEQKAVLKQVISWLNWLWCYSFRFSVKCNTRKQVEPLLALKKTFAIKKNVALKVKVVDFPNLKNSFG